MAIESLSDIQKSGISAFAAGGSSVFFVDASLGDKPKRAGKFIIVDASIMSTMNLNVDLMPSPYTGKGPTQSDESELMGPVQFVAKAQDGQATVYWSSPYVQRGVVSVKYSKE